MPLLKRQEKEIKNKLWIKIFSSVVISQHQFVELLAISMSLFEDGITRSICLWHVYLPQKSSNIFIIIFMQLSIFTLWSPGSYGDQTRRQILPNSTPIFVPSNAEIVASVIRHRGIGIVPVSNPYGGSVNESWEALEKCREELIIAGSHILTLDHAIVQRKEHVWSKYAEYSLILKHTIRVNRRLIRFILVMNFEKVRALLVLSIW